MPKHTKALGFTLIELLVVMAIIATLLTISVPRYLGQIDKAKEAVLRENLSAIRESIDKYHTDTGSYPSTLEDLVTKKYLRKIPPDPITDSAESWTIVQPEDARQGGVYDVKSSATGKAIDGSSYNEW